MPTESPLPESTEVILLAGFLGSGKTTLLKRILSWDADLSQTVVLINEFGEIGIDGLLLKNAGSDVIELTSGCICCTLSADLRRSLDRVWHRYHPRRLLIEASGVADPKTLLPVLQEAAFKNKFTLKKTITVLDADYWEARGVFGPLFYHQLETADLILLNKIDRIDPEKVPRFMQQIHECIGDCPVLPAYHCGVDPEALFSSSPPKAFAIPPIQFYRAPWAGSPQSPPLGRSPAGAPGNDTQRHTSETPVSAAGFVTFSFTASTPLDETRFQRFLQRLPWEVFRVKGPVCFPDRLEMLNFVGNKADWTPWAGKPETRLAFIGWGVEGSAIIEKLKKCLVPTE